MEMKKKRDAATQTESPITLNDERLFNQFRYDLKDVPFQMVHGRPYYFGAPLLTYDEYIQPPTCLNPLSVDWKSFSRERRQHLTL